VLSRRELRAGSSAGLVVDTVVHGSLENPAWRFTREGVGLTPLLGARGATLRAACQALLQLSLDAARCWSHTAAMRRLGAYTLPGSRDASVSAVQFNRRVFAMPSAATPDSDAFTPPSA